MEDEIYKELSIQPFVVDLAKKYKGVYPFDISTIKVEHYDEFGQCVVYLGFEDQFAIKDAQGSWRLATAEECVQLKQGNLKGSMNLM
ncbi:hypothetical protein LW139_07055 [Proteus vulgaris]|uniref:hypothetical protein n=1 Tax=Proteus vulgaris TaxID=585 RepID=UPI001FFF7FEB|nr:hypothetical protein [Proteus vulgaris]UPK82443.1 hypothetical protein LW139_07055 [Proteus vulgaris]